MPAQSLPLRRQGLASTPLMSMLRSLTLGFRRVDSRLRGNDEVVEYRMRGFVIPVQTGIQVFLSVKSAIQATKAA
jgi:hypothetical protein